MADEYATTTQIQSEFKSTTFGAGTQVTLAEIGEWLEEFSRLLDGMISNKFETPLSNASALFIAELIVRNWVSARIMRILNAESVAPSPDEESRANILDKQATAWAKLIMEGDIDLFGQTKTSRVTTDSFQRNRENVFIYDKDIDQW
jgi:hypothetical protein